MLTVRMSNSYQPRPGVPLAVRKFMSSMARSASERMTPEQRRERARMAALAGWRKRAKVVKE